jgi:hypothetical protein
VEGKLDLGDLRATRLLFRTGQSGREQSSVDETKEAHREVRTRRGCGSGAKIGLTAREPPALFGARMVYDSAAKSAKQTSVDPE